MEEVVSNDAFPIGIDDPTPYKESHLTLEPGDQVFVYTDGILDCANDENEPFGMDRIIELMSTAGCEDIGQSGELIIESLRNHVGETDQLDDVCLVGLGCNKK